MKRLICKATLILATLPLCAMATQAPAKTISKQDFLSMMNGKFSTHFASKFCEGTYKKAALAKAGQYTEADAEKVVAYIKSVAPESDCPKLATAILKGVTKAAAKKLPATLTPAQVNKHLVAIAQQTGEIYGGYYTALGAYTASAKTHNAQSEHALYRLYSTDRPGIPKDMSKANYWLKRAKKDGYQSPKK